MSRPNQINDLFLGALRDAGTEGLTLRELRARTQCAFTLRALEYAGRRLTQTGHLTRELTRHAAGHQAPCYRYRLANP